MRSEIGDMLILVRPYKEGRKPPITKSDLRRLSSYADTNGAKSTRRVAASKVGVVREAEKVRPLGLPGGLGDIPPKSSLPPLYAGAFSASKPSSRRVASGVLRRPPRTSTFGAPKARLRDRPGGPFYHSKTYFFQLFRFGAKMGPDPKKVGVSSFLPPVSDQGDLRKWTPGPFREGSKTGPFPSPSKGRL